MAKRKSNKKHHVGAKSKSFANFQLPRMSLSKLTPHTYKLSLATYSGIDQRRFNPVKKHLRPARTILGTQAPTRSTVKSNLSRKLYETHTFTLPKKTAVCIRRQSRKEVLFATGKGGKRHNNRRSRRNQHSYISCKKKR